MSEEGKPPFIDTDNAIKIRIYSKVDMQAKERDCWKGDIS